MSHLCVRRTVAVQIHPLPQTLLIAVPLIARAKSAIPRILLGTSFLHTEDERMGTITDGDGR